MVVVTSAAIGPRRRVGGCMAGEFADKIITFGGLPAHPLVVHVVVVLLPLAAICAVALAVRPAWRRRYEWPVLVLAAVGVGAVPVTQKTGEQLLSKLTLMDSPVLQHHADLSQQLLPYALGFGVALVVLLVAGRLADRERAAQTAAEQAAPTTDANATDSGPTVSTAWRRIAILASVLVVATAAATTVQVLRTSNSGTSAVWQGIAN